MTKPNNDPNIKPPRFRDAFERLASEIRAVPDSDLVPITLDALSVVATVLGVYARIRDYRDEIVQHLPTFDIGRFDRLEAYALALGHAQTEYQTATEPPASLVKLAAKVSRSRSILLNDINALVARELLPQNVLKELKGGTGHKNFAFDVFALSNLYRHHWDKVSAHTGVRREELDEVERDADALTTAVGEREQSPAALAQVVRDRQAAFTLVVEVYDEIRTVFAYLRRKQGDAERLLPSLYLGRTSSKKSHQSNRDDRASESPGAPVTTVSDAPVPDAHVSSAPVSAATVGTSVAPSGLSQQ